MSPELKLYYQHVQIKHIAKGANCPVQTMTARLSKERARLNLKPRGRVESHEVSKDVAEFIADKDMVMQLYKADITLQDIADKWGVARNTLIKYLRLWGAMCGSDKFLNTITLAGLYTGWADIPRGEEMLLTVNKRPTFKLVRII